MDYQPTTFKHYKIWKDLTHPSGSACDRYILTDQHNFYLGEIYQDKRRSELPNVCHFTLEDDSNLCGTISERDYNLVAIEIVSTNGGSNCQMTLGEYGDGEDPKVIEVRQTNLNFG